MDVIIIDFPETKVAVVEYRGAPELEYEAAKKLIAWRMEHRLSPAIHQSYGIHFDDPVTTPPERYRVDFCVSHDDEVEINSYGVVSKLIPAGRCAVVRYLGPRDNITAARELYENWLPSSGEKLRDFPIFFHYVNVGPDIKSAEMITDVYLPLC